MTAVAPWTHDYVAHWLTDFPEGPQRIFIVSGNTDSSDYSTALTICYAFEKTFSNWKSVGEHLLEIKSSFPWGLVDIAYEDPDGDDGEFADKVDALSNITEAFDLVIDNSYTDPCIIVREYDPLFAWLTFGKRGFATLEIPKPPPELNDEHKNA